MSENKSEHITRRRNGYILLVGAAAVLLLGILVGVQTGNVREYSLGGLFMAAILVAFGGFSLWSSDRERSVPDEDRARRHDRAGHFALWILVGVMPLNTVLQIIPGEYAVGTVYAILGILSYVIVLLAATAVDRRSWGVSGRSS